MALPEALFIAQKEKNEGEKERSKEKNRKGTSLSQMRTREGDGVPPTLEECQAYAATTGQSPRSSAGISSRFGESADDGLANCER